MSEYITMRDCLKLDLKDAISQRNEAREAFAIATNNCVDAQQRLREMQDQRDFAMSEMERLKRERDQARNLAESAMLEADRLRSQLWRARDRAWQIARERSRLKSQISNLQSP